MKSLYQRQPRQQFIDDISQMGEITPHTQRAYVCKSIAHRNSCDDISSTSTYEPTHGQSALCRAKPVNVYYGLEDFVWVHGLGGERLHATCYSIRLNLEKSIARHRKRTENVCRLFVTHQRINYFHITDRRVSTVIVRCVRVPKDGATFRLRSLSFGRSTPAVDSGSRPSGLT